MHLKSIEPSVYREVPQIALFGFMGQLTVLEGLLWVFLLYDPLFSDTLTHFFCHSHCTRGGVV